MAETDINFETDLTPAFTSLNSLASDTTAGLLVACSAAVDVTSSTGLDYVPFVTVSYPNSAPTVAYLSAYYALYNGSTWTDDGYSDAPDGTDQTITIGLPTCLKFAGLIPVLQNKPTTACPLLSLASAVGAPVKQFSVVVHNGSGQTLNSSGNSLRVAVLTATTV